MKRSPLPVRIFKLVLELSFGAVVLTSFTAFLILMIPAYAYRLILCKAWPLVARRQSKMVSSLGQVHADDFYQKVNRSVIMTTASVKTDASATEIKQMLADHIIYKRNSNGEFQYPEWQQMVTRTLGFYFWKPEVNFCFDDHIHVIQSGSEPFTDEEWKSFMEKKLNEPFPPDKSPWDFTIIENYCDPSVSLEPMKVAILRVHHCLTDGYGMLFSMVGNLGGMEELSNPQIKKSGGRRWFTTLKFILAVPFLTMIELLRYSLLCFQNHPWKVSSHKQQKLIYGKTQLIPIEKIKTIKDKFGVTFTSVTHSAFGAAARQILAQKHGAKVRNIPSAFLLPLFNHPNKLRNHYTIAYTKLMIASSDSVERLMQCEHKLQIAKKSVVPILCRFLLFAYNCLPIGLATLMVYNRAFPIVISNFPIGLMLNSKYEMFGGKLVRMSAAAGPSPGLSGITCGVYSYEDDVHLTVVADRAIMSHEELQSFVLAIENEIDALYMLSIA